MRTASCISSEYHAVYHFHMQNIYHLFPNMSCCLLITFNHNNFGDIRWICDIGPSLAVNAIIITITVITKLSGATLTYHLVIYLIKAGYVAKLIWQLDY